MDHAFFDELAKTAGIASAASRIYQLAATRGAVKNSKQALDAARHATNEVSHVRNLAEVAPILGLGGGTAAGIAAAKAMRKRD